MRSIKKNVLSVALIFIDRAGSLTVIKRDRTQIQEIIPQKKSLTNIVRTKRCFMMIAAAR
jgi:hypothetical protein